MNTRHGWSSAFLPHLGNFIYVCSPRWWGMRKSPEKLVNMIEVNRWFVATADGCLDKTTTNNIRRSMVQREGCQKHQMPRMDIFDVISPDLMVWLIVQGRVPGEKNIGVLFHGRAWKHLTPIDNGLSSLARRGYLTWMAVIKVNCGQFQMAILSGDC